jgi:hypothetical protein
MKPAKPRACKVCSEPATHGFRPPSTPANREPDFEPRCDDHGYDAHKAIVTGRVREVAYA